MNPFSFINLNDKQQKAYRVRSYDEVLLNSILPMVEWDGLPESVNVRFLEYLRIMEGAVALWYLDNELICSHVSFGGMPYYDGLGSIAICTTNNGKNVSFENWRENPDICIVFNDSTYSPDVNIGRFADMLSEVETSMKFNVLYSRLYPIPIVKDEHMKKAIETTLNNMKCGQFATLLDKNAYDPFSENEKGIDILNLTDVSLSDKIQYLAKFRDDLFRWFYSLYGMNTQGSSKLAQQTQSETEQNSNASMIIPMNRLLEAERGCEMLAKKFGIEASVCFSECWQSKIIDLDIDDDGIIDETEAPDEQEESRVKDED